ncbi:orotidine 5'-phosphate decarboxylase / HUMPS family protein [Sulfurisphaera ohwakuensis]|uniref:3-hexulose-6-phosphate synthase n=2 Tax=Sulfurisphaera ohwakuensis TaxID=69656 RepID=A0A650CDK3_SULOH|nr:orotidine 5'-phosphate decarboxylase / HUMPS family protein [Sulfurisphaera ohwakuensis]QGR15872.1 3-hexulose-6-phosphate synthase [Sulfurisphaera ohwakuensis]
MMELLEKLLKSKNLQVALDFIDLKNAEEIAKQSIEAGADILEVGTPLIKSYGIQGIRRIREIAKERIVLADTKTADAGDVEAEIVHLGGGNIMTVLGIMDDATIESAVKKAHEYGILVQADLINVKDILKRAEEIKRLGVDIIGLHVGLDVQKKRGITISDLKNEIKKVSELGVIVSVAGGLNKNNIVDLIDLPINIYVVGGAITRAKNPLEEAKQIVKIIKG